MLPPTYTGRLFVLWKFSSNLVRPHHLLGLNDELSDGNFAVMLGRVRDDEFRRRVAGRLQYPRFRCNFELESRFRRKVRSKRGGLGDHISQLERHGRDTICGSLDGDDVVNVDDLLSMLSNWYGNSCLVDLTLDDVVDTADVIELITQWGACPTE